MLSASEISAVTLSLQVAVLCTFLMIPLAVPVGYVLARREFPGKSAAEAVLYLPLVLPPVTTGFLLLKTFGSQGILGRFFEGFLGFKLAFAFPGAVLAALVVSFPLAVRSIKTALEMLDPDLEAVSRTLGVGALKTFFRITLPLALPGIISAGVLTFARSLGEFGATITFAGNIEGKTRTLASGIYTSMQIPGEEAATLRLVLFTIFLSLGAMLLSEWINRKRKSRDPV